MWPFTTTAATQPEPSPASGCPVDHETRATWTRQHQPQSNPVPSDVAAQNPLARQLSTEREVSSIPRWLPPSSGAATEGAAPSTSTSRGEGPPPACPMHEANANSAEQAATLSTESNWVYPSPASFYTALERKNRQPRAQDMDIVVPIHNAVNERVWQQVLDWEREAMGLPKGAETGSRLVSFVGKPRQMSPRARWKSLIGYTAPFDRHDWIVDRPLRPPPPSSSSTFSSSPSAPPSSSSSKTTSPSSPNSQTVPAGATAAVEPESIRVRYVIDFYTGRGKNLLLSPPPSSSSSPSSPEAQPAPEEIFRPNLAFFIDCRPALDGWEGVRMRFNKYWGLASTTDGQERGPSA
ncbi:hypothetical protein JCM10908_004917 [Rhodotorula pacifica]|uniref:uncharacterized protein n=1 Tax=Rhodotorula pacifica TaxID=1495444 RepID=UPI00317B9213